MEQGKSLVEKGLWKIPWVIYFFTLLSIYVIGDIYFIRGVLRIGRSDPLLTQLQINWDRELFSDVKFIASPGLCESDYSDYLEYYWSGITDYCICEDDSSLKRGQCTRSSKQQGVCSGTQMNGVGGQILNEFTFGGTDSGRICVKKIYGYNFKKSSKYQLSDSCDSGEQICGQYCVPKDSECPIAELIVTSSSTEAGYESVQIGSGSQYLHFKRTDASSEYPLIAARVQGGGGVCRDESVNSLSWGRDQPPLESIQSQVYTECQVSKFWKRLQEDQNMGELEFFNLNDLSTTMQASSFFLSNYYKMRIHQRRYPEIVDKQCLTRISDWNKQIKDYENAQKGLQITGLVFNQFLIIYIIVYLIRSCYYYSKTSENQVKNFPGAVYGLFIYPDPTSLSVKIRIAKIFQSLRIVILIIIWISVILSKIRFDKNYQFFQDQSSCGPEFEQIAISTNHDRNNPFEIAMIYLLAAEFILDAQTFQILQKIFLFLTCQSSNKSEYQNQIIQERYRLN